MKATIQQHRGDLDAAETACADMEIGLDELTPNPSSTPSSSRKRPQDLDSALLESLQKLLSPAPSSRTSPKPSSSPSQPEQPLPTTLKTACWPCPRSSTRRQSPPSASCCLTWWMRKATQEASHSEQPHPLRPSSSPPFSSFGSSAPSISEQYQPPPTCGETCLQDHQCGVLSLWSTWSSTTSNPYSIHIITCLLFLDSRCLVLSAVYYSRGQGSGVLTNYVLFAVYCKV